jgi:hypothetical protein
MAKRADLNLTTTKNLAALDYLDRNSAGHVAEWFEEQGGRRFATRVPTGTFHHLFAFSFYSLVWHHTIPFGLAPHNHFSCLQLWACTTRLQFSFHSHWS